MTHTAKVMNKIDDGMNEWSHETAGPNRYQLDGYDTPQTDLDLDQFRRFDFAFYAHIRSPAGATTRGYFRPHLRNHSSKKAGLRVQKTFQLPSSTIPGVSQNIS
ncbi:hypothetical protein SRHO_G00187780 [Serrasalmus rhombeus]